MNQPEDLRGSFAPIPPAVSRPNAGFSPAPLTNEDRMAPPFDGVTASTQQPVAEMRLDEVVGEGSVEPAFEAVVDATTEALAELAGAKTEEFPLDAFIIPEDAQRVPTGMEGNAAPTQPIHSPASELAERIEKLSHRLRVEDPKVVIEKLASGDRLDAMLAGLLAGYLSK